MHAEQNAAISPICKHAAANDMANLLNAHTLNNCPLWHLLVTAKEI
jgi:hypothetical protein